jgi:membrane protease YdiL (CAAX protease family)
MKKSFLLLFALFLLVAIGEALILPRVPLDPARLAAFLACFVLMLAAFVAFSVPGFVKLLRARALHSPAYALGLPFLLLVPYLILALTTRTFSIPALLKLAAYIAVPTLFLLPDRLHRAERVGWRDFAAMLALGLPVSAGWLGGIWVWPEDLYFFRPLFSVSVGAYAFLVIRNLEGVGYRLTFRKADVLDGVANFVAFALVAIPLGYALGFIAFHPSRVSIGEFALQFLGIYLTVAIPEELLFRGILQNFLVRSIRSARRGLFGLLTAAVIFGASHLHHAPVPNWKYALMATLAGIFYGNAYRSRQRLSSPALTHTLVDTVWRFWF